MMETVPSVRVRNVVLAAMALFVAAWPLLTPVSPLQDQMDWVLQADIIAGAGAPGWAQNYAVHLRPVPNLLGTLLIALLALVLPIFTAAAVAYSLYVLLFVAGFVYLARADGKQRPTAELVGGLYAANHFFLMGFFNFALGLALALVTLGYLRRRAADMRGWHWLALAALAMLTYLSHFLAFAAVGLGALLIGQATFGKNLRKWSALALSFAPALAALAWYAASRSGELFFHYVYHNPLYFIWYKVGPWAPASSYYPLTPTPAVWANAALNAAAIVAIGLFVAWGILKRKLDWREPLVATALVLIAIGLVTPTRLFELLRPGQRLIFVGVMLLFAAVTPGGKSRYRVAAAAVAALLVWNAVWWMQASNLLEKDLRVIEAEVPPRAKMLIVADSHFHFRENRSYAAKAADPYAYPNSVNPLRYLPYHRVVTGGGYLRDLFSTGIVEVRDPERLPAVNRIWHLENPDKAGLYTHLIATGQPENLRKIAARAAPLFDERYLGDRLLVMRRKVD
jgi:hypothetical protein